ncbi:hypothetical protein TRVL_02654 [Trypanosoma vivax]|nr:hypothetical protein TRVL_02654 [Trypanosoma vivax]
MAFVRGFAATGQIARIAAQAQKQKHKQGNEEAGGKPEKRGHIRLQRVRKGPGKKDKGRRTCTRGRPTTKHGGNWTRVRGARVDPHGNAAIDEELWAQGEWRKRKTTCGSPPRNSAEA